jgi:4-hydroxybenzoate polyprenyltransferase
LTFDRAKIMGNGLAHSGLRGSLLWQYLQLMRPANLVTANADVLAGFAVAGLKAPAHLPWLLVSTTALYAGGVVLNDVFDARLDRIERPERPIPSGNVSRLNAARFGAALLAAGVVSALTASPMSGIIALLIAACAVVYDAWGKRQPLLGPINMGACRGLNLLLGISVVPSIVLPSWYLALIPVLYIAAITAVSRGEVHGGAKGPGLLALVLQSVVLVAVCAVAAVRGISGIWAAPFVLLWAWRVLPPFREAYIEPEPSHIRRAVKAGVLSLIALDASLAAAFAGPFYGLVVLSLLPAAGNIARLFAVT